MRKILYFVSACIAMASMAGCMGEKASNVQEVADSTDVEVVDSAVYGIVDESTTMHSLVIVTDEGKKLEFEVDVDSVSDVQGGLFAGDRITLVTAKAENGMAVKKALNMTTLLGKWTSLDRNFEIKEDGTVESFMKAESNPYTQWNTTNANLILNADTLQVLLLGPDSLTIENDKGIFVYKRQRLATKK